MQTVVAIISLGSKAVHDVIQRFNFTIHLLLIFKNFGGGGCK